MDGGRWQSGRMRVVLALDKFKGTLTASEVTERARRGVLRVLPDADVLPVAVADGGDGTIDALVAAGFEVVPVRVAGPTGRPVTARIARLGAVAAVELADCCGLVRLGGALAPWDAGTRGLGEAIHAAIGLAGVHEVVVGIGGSASTDGGAGLLAALGVRLLDADGEPVPPGARGLTSLARVDVSGLDPRLSGPDAVRLTVASDVDAPLLGPRGAASVFGPQKGLGAGDIPVVDAALARLADLVEPLLRPARELPGAGAAGGTGWALLALGAALRPGVSLVLGLAGFDALVAGADLVITGEGSLDAQTLTGKTPVGVARAASGVPCVAVCGRLELTPDQLHAAGIAAALPLTDLAAEPADAVRRAGPLVEDAVAQLVARFLLGPAAYAGDDRG